MATDSLGAEHPLAAAIAETFGANPRLHAIAARNAGDFLRAAGKVRAAYDLESALP
jgi:hypothetical protein